MKKLLLSSVFCIGAAVANAQVADSVTIGAGYANQIWYSLANDEQGTAPKNDWDLAFDMVDIMSTIHINTVNGVALWGYPKDDISGWATVDTNGLSTWGSRSNTDTSWSVGAMGAYADPADMTDLDWGRYNMSTHTVNGDSIYIVKLGNGDFKKLIIQSLVSGTYTFKYANIDGSNEQTATIVKGNFANKNFAYYSIQNGAALAANREPDNDKWDLLFTQYTAILPPPYGVTGVLHNRGVEVAQVKTPGVDTFVNFYPHPFGSAINIIGYDWKAFVGGTYVAKDSIVYFVRTTNQDVWKLVFTGFDMTNGKFVFNKQRLYATNIAGVESKKNSLALYPNPSNGAAVTVVYTLDAGINNAILNVYDMSGRIIHRDMLDAQPGMHQHVLPQSIPAGVYVISVDTEKGRMQQRLVIQ